MAKKRDWTSVVVQFRNPFTLLAIGRQLQTRLQFHFGMGLGGHPTPPQYPPPQQHPPPCHGVGWGGAKSFDYKN